MLLSPRQNGLDSFLKEVRVSVQNFLTKITLPNLAIFFELLRECFRPNSGRNKGVVFTRVSFRKGFDTNPREHSCGLLFGRYFPRSERALQLYLGALEDFFLGGGENGVLENGVLSPAERCVPGGGVWG